FLDLYPPPTPHPPQMRLRPHQCTHRAQFELRAHRSGLLHLLDAHVDDIELSMGDNHAIDAQIAASLDDSERLGRRQVPGVDHELLLGADFQHLTHGRQNLPLSAEHLDALRCLVEMLDMMVGIKGWKPHDAAESALHAPHPGYGIRIDPAD